jgi:two-component system cell cycle sensor histidine kinase/response regulator CckA
LTGSGVILAVDDSQDSLIMLTGILAEEGYDVRPADSGILALASVESSKPDLILLDIRMPGMDGFEVCRRLKERIDSRDIPVVFISSLTDLSDRVQGLELGAVDFISKPFQRQELLARIRTHLELSRLRSRLEQRVLERTAQLIAANEQLRLELAERRRAEQESLESERLFRSMADAAPVIVWTSGADTQINFVNKYALTFTGRTFEDLTGDRWKEVIHPQDLERDYPAHIPLVAAQREYRAEYRLRRADGEYRWMLDTASPRRLAGGSFAGYIGILIDISDLKQNQERLLAAQKLESLGVLVSGLAHNFNNLMGAIIAEADLGLSELPPDSAPYGNVERISEIAIRAADIVFTLTVYASPAPAGQQTAINLSSVVEEVMQLIKATVSRNIVFSIDVAPKVPTIRADMSHMRQVVMNLLTNACESLDAQGGLICVTTSHVRLGRADPCKNPWGLTEGDFVKLTVSDTGCGITSAMRSRIFDPFYTTKFLGRGLGLAAVQGIVRSLGGAIEVQSTTGSGSTFQVLFPCGDAHP